MSRMYIAMYGLAWLLAAWAFIGFGPERLRASQTLRVMGWRERIVWGMNHPWTAFLVIGLKSFQIGFVIWQAQFVSHALPMTSFFLEGQMYLAIAIVVLGTRKLLRESLTIYTAGPEYHTGRMVKLWQIHNYHKGIILFSDGSTQEGYVSEEVAANEAGEKVAVGLIPQPLCLVAWLCNGIALALNLAVAFL